MTLHHPFLLKTTEQRDRKLVKGAYIIRVGKIARVGGGWVIFAGFVGLNKV